MSQSSSRQDKGSVKETLISITIALVVAFVFRAFVIEAFVIPTGSMAPTLMGQHIRFQSPQTGYVWAVNPWHDVVRSDGSRLPAATQPNLQATDPMSGHRVGPVTQRLRSGDRILVLKYLTGVFDPKRFDAIVFKAPHEPQVNYIKRLLGLPGEQVALVDGDPFVRVPAPGEPPLTEDDAWTRDNWRIARKPERVQRAVWQEVFSSEYQPLQPERIERPRYRAPWDGAQGQWQIDGRRAYRLDSEDRAVLRWNHERWPIGDRYPYNEVDQPGGARLAWPSSGAFTQFLTSQGTLVYPVADIRMRAGIEPDRAGLTVTAVIVARGYEFRGVIEGTEARVEMRPYHPTQDTGPWQILDRRPCPSLDSGRVVNVEFWHADQALTLWIDDRAVARGEYDWGPAERITHATGRSLAWILDESRRTGRNLLADPNLYAKPPTQPRWEFSGSPLTLHRVGVDRDIHYQPSNPRGDRFFAGHPSRTASLTSRRAGPGSKDQYFVCGDNSPSSLDGRGWEAVDPWVSVEMDNDTGIVPQRLVIGKAFGVYFPSLLWGRNVPMVDFGRVRWIW